MGAAYLCAEAGISTAVIDKQAVYVAGWLKKVRDDRRLVIQAAAQAACSASQIMLKKPEVGTEWALTEGAFGHF
jgi:antirestriction protein ArdC